MQSDGQPDLYMNCVIGLVHKWFGDELPKQLFAAWAGDARQTVYDDLAWLALENAVYEKELPKRPALAALRQAHASAFFESEYQLSRQEWMEKNQLVYAIQSARWKTVLGQRLPVLTPWEKDCREALALSRYHEWRGGSGGDPDCLPKISPLTAPPTPKRPLPSISESGGRRC